MKRIGYQRPAPNPISYHLTPNLSTNGATISYRRKWGISYRRSEAAISYRNIPRRILSLYQGHIVSRIAVSDIPVSDIGAPPLLPLSTPRASKGVSNRPGAGEISVPNM